MNDVNPAMEKIVKISVKRSSILAHFVEHVCAIQNLVNLSVQQKVMFTNAMTNLLELHGSSRLIYSSDYS